MELIDVTVIDQADSVKLNGAFRYDNCSKIQNVYFQYPREYKQWLDSSGNAFIPFLLAIASIKNENLHSHVAISPEILTICERITDIYLAWHPTMHRVKVTAPSLESSNISAKSQRSSAQLFSGGVDSFYTLAASRSGLLDYVPPITHLLLIISTKGPKYQGYGGIKLKDHIDPSLPLQQFVTAQNLNCLPIITNCRDYELFGLWNELYHGPVMLGVGLGLGKLFGNVFITSNFDYMHLNPFGCHPYTDNQWKTHTTAFHHIGCEALRSDKMAYIVEHFPEALEFLSPCTRAYSGKNNCGVCTKCIRSILMADVIGILPQMTSFPQTPLENTVIEKFIQDEEIAYLTDIYIKIQKHGYDKNITKKIEKELQRRRQRTALIGVLKNTQGLKQLVPLLKKARDTIKRR